MNVPVDKSRYSVQVADDAELATLVGQLFATLHHEREGSTTRAVLANYLDVLSDIPGWAVEHVCDEYRRGIRGDGRFVPMAGELARAARGVVAARAEVERQQAGRKRDAELLAEQFAELKQRELVRAEITPESKARVQQKLEEAKAIIAENQLAEEKRNQGPSIHEQTHEKYRAQGREALLKSLGKQKLVAERGPEPEFQGEASHGASHGR